jgi:transposase, IS30 family
MGMRRPRMSWHERHELWRRWRAGESLVDIAAALDRERTGLGNIVIAAGGIAPRAPRRSRLALTAGEREEISRGLARHETVRHLARGLRRAPSTISREIRRHGGRAAYRAQRADARAWARARRPKPCHLATRPALRRLIAAKLAQQWSPQQIAGWLRRTFPSDPDRQVSHETIYRSLFVQSRGVLKRELTQHLRQHRGRRQARAARRVGHYPGHIVEAVSIRQRPADATDRAVPGHWEGDLLMGARRASQVATLVERQSRYVILVRVPAADTQTVVRALARRVRRLPAGLRRSLTWDRGTELAAHRAFTVATNVQVYFCDPQSPWQRGSNENTNGLLRQYLPKGTDLAPYTQAQLDAIALRLNTRPRLTLGYQTPAAKLAEIVASIT